MFVIKPSVKLKYISALRDCDGRTGRERVQLHQRGGGPHYEQNRGGGGDTQADQAAGEIGMKTDIENENSIKIVFALYLCYRYLKHSLDIFVIISDSYPVTEINNTG